MINQDLLPLFPLNTVLFPGQLLPLHVFEERYQTMIKECLQGEAVFGVVMIREGYEVGQTAIPFEVGTIARIRRVDQSHEQKINLLCLGEARFKILSLNYDHPYLAARIEVWPWLPLPEDEIEPRSSVLKGLLTRYLKLLANIANSKVDLQNLPDDPLLIADLSAIALQISNHEKQRLLSEPGQAEFIDTCIAFLKRETLSLEQLASLPMVMDDKPTSFSVN
jgi:Lon protease-like protein